MISLRGFEWFRLWVRRCLRRIQDARIQSTHVLSQIEQQRLDLEHASIKEKQILSLAIQGVVERGLNAIRETINAEFERTRNERVKENVAQAERFISANQAVLDAIQDEKARLGIIQNEAHAVQEQTLKFENATLKKQKSNKRKKTKIAHAGEKGSGKRVGL
jgi:hypothetical protein